MNMMDVKPEEFSCPVGRCRNTPTTVCHAVSYDRTGEMTDHWDVACDRHAVRVQSDVQSEADQADAWVA